MSLSVVISVVLTVAVLVLVWYAISALIQLKKTLENVDSLVCNVNERICPLLTDMDVVVNKVDSELGRLDEIVSTVRDISDKVNATTRVVHEVISSPLIKAASVSAGARGAIKKLVGR